MTVIDNTMAGWSNEPDQWKGTYEHSHTYFEVAVQSKREMTGNAEQKNFSGIRVQPNIHVDFKFRRHLNTFDWNDPDQERKEWVRSLRPGDRIQLYATARYFGWKFYVQMVKMSVRYNEEARREGDRDRSAAASKIFTKSTRTRSKKSSEDNVSRQPRTVIYHQCLHSESGIPTSLRPLAREETGLTAVILGKFQLRFNHNKAAFPTHESTENCYAKMYLHECELDDSSIENIWNDIEYLQHENIKVLGMLTMQGDYSWKGPAFEHSYRLLHGLVVSKKLDGIDLDLAEIPQWDDDTAKEQKRALLDDVIRLIDKLHADFGAGFIITMTIYVEALLDMSDENQQNINNSFDYRALELQRGDLIDWYNVRIFSDNNRRRQGIDRQTESTNDSGPDFVRELSSLIRLLDHDSIYSPHKIVIAISTFPTNSKPKSTGLAAHVPGQVPPGDIDATMILRLNDQDYHDHGAYIEPSYLHRLLELLHWSYGPFYDFGGVAGWEYSRSHTPAVESTAGGGESIIWGGYDRPWEWVKCMKMILDNVFSNPNDQVAEDLS